MQKFLLVVAFVLFSFFSKSQNIQNFFGVINENDLKSKYYEKDSTAEAVVLYDCGKYIINIAHFNEEPNLIFERHTRIKLYRKTGFRWATVKLRKMIGSKFLENYKDLRATIYNLENGVIKKYELKKEDFFDEKSSENNNTISFTFPQLTEGSIIEYSYKLNSNVWYQLSNWNFQWIIPVVYSEMQTNIPGQYRFKIIYEGYQDFDIQEPIAEEAKLLDKYPLGIYQHFRWVMKNIPALEEKESYITTPEDFRAKMTFELERTTSLNHISIQSYSENWESLTQTFLKHKDFGEALKYFGKAQGIIDIITEKEKLSMAKAAYNAIRKQMVWNGNYGCFTDEKLNEAWDKGLGNSAEINLMLVHVLRKMGIEANPVILSTREHGKLLPEYALLKRFNYVIAQIQIEEKNYLLDATDRNVKFGMIPQKCLNGQGWLIDKSNPRWISLTPTDKYFKYTTWDFDIAETQQLKGKTSLAYMGYAAAEIRSMYKQKTIFQDEVKKIFPSFEHFAIEILGFEDINENIILNVETIVNEGCTMTGNLIYLKPLLWEAMKETPFNNKDRNYPVDFSFPFETIIQASFSIPKGYVVEELPKNENNSLPNNAGRFDYGIQIIDNQIKVSSRIQMKKAVFESREYSSLREFYSRIVSKQAEFIVLKKTQ